MRPLAIFLNVMGFLSALYLPTVTALLTFKILTVDTLGWSKWVLLPTAIIFLVVTASKEWVPRLKPSRNIIMIATRAFLDNNRLLLLEKIKQINGGKEVECRTNIAVIKRKKLFWKVIKTKYYDSNYKEDDADYDITFRINEGLVGLVAYRTTVIQEAGKKTYKARRASAICGFRLA